MPKAEAGNMRKARVLCLHGYAQNAEFFRSRLGALRKALKSVVADFHFIDAPHAATAEFLGDVPEDRGAALGWFNPKETTKGARPAISREYVGLEASLRAVRRAVEEHGPFDGVLGFSQGGTIAALCCLRPELWWEGPHSPFGFAVLFSAFEPRDASFALAASPSDPPVVLPSFHCFGLADPSVPPASSKRVAARFSGAREHEHEGGHGVPSDAQLRNALKEFVATATAQSQGGHMSAALPAKPSSGDAASARDQSNDGVIGSYLHTYMVWRQLHAYE
jgi:predicted esterase